jgi:hypothetical protein
VGDRQPKSRNRRSVKSGASDLGHVRSVIADEITRLGGPPVALGGELAEDEASGNVGSALGIEAAGTTVGGNRRAELERVLQGAHYTLRHGVLTLYTSSPAQASALEMDSDRIAALVRDYLGLKEPPQVVVRLSSGKNS